ncbi:aldo/keto reductase [Hydrogenivirga sp. 128-5-R1-1]|uniref:aldo/keto reductase n=1 Tax=Hydrogenivirga sp. 128-5-R1-1 TaxID=392423 RepID=UPI00015EF7E0|nr:aldo/keto reductase [Hydrogenivirga sp. 128-5-R1-1]EDP74913.1 Aldo/keto reductase [Hydrogenivirga sp. 128-5-R1-1]
MKKLALGTAQFGLDYGIANERGKIPKEEVFKILDLALDKGIDTLDTARAYGEAEKILGEYPKIKRFKVITKFSENAEEELNESLQSLKLRKVYGLLAHRAEVFIKDPSLWDEVLKLKMEGLVDKVGFSIYFPWELERLLELNFDIVQVPYNVLDRRFEPLLPKLKNRGIEVHVRSAFLQGLLLIDLTELNPFFDDIKPILLELRKLSQNKGVELKDLLLCYVLKNPHVDKVVVGVDSIKQLELNLAVECSKDIEVPRYDIDEKFLVPFMWKV